MSLNELNGQPASVLAADSAPESAECLAADETAAWSESLAYAARCLAENRGETWPSERPAATRHLAENQGEAWPLGRPAATRHLAENDSLSRLAPCPEDPFADDVIEDGGGYAIQAYAPLPRQAPPPTLFSYAQEVERKSRRRTQRGSKYHAIVGRELGTL